MNIPNRITPDAFVRMPIGEIAALPAEELARLQQETDEALRAAKAASAWLDGALAIKYADRAEAARRDAGKDFGTARFIDGDVTVVAELPKKVDWDQVATRPVGRAHQGRRRRSPRVCRHQLQGPGAQVRGVAVAYPL